MTAGIAFAILGFAALAGQGGQAAASDAQAQVPDTALVLAADRQSAQEQHAAGRSAQRDFLAQAESVVTKPTEPAAAPDKAAEPAKTEPTESTESTASKPEAAPAAPAAEEPAEPTPVAGLDQVQMNNAKKIVDTAKSMGLGKDAQVIAIATAMQESTLYNRASTVLPESYNYPHEGDGSDFDSVGLFQQRTSTGWGAVRDLMKPEFATKQFLEALIRVDGWQNMPLTVAAQTVQGSAFPDHYAKHEGFANIVVDALNK
jgi:hypothetical protein